MAFNGFRKALLGAVLLALGACAAQGGSSTASNPAWSGHSEAKAEDLLAQSADRAAKARETLARVERTRTPPAPTPVDETGLPPELRLPTTVDWSGPAPEVAERLAAGIGYEFRILGNPPANPPMANLSVQDLSVVKVLEDIGLQVQPGAQIVIDPNARRVEFRYLGGHELLDAPELPQAPARTAKARAASKK